MQVQEKSNQLISNLPKNKSGIYRSPLYSYPCKCTNKATNSILTFPTTIGNSALLFGSVPTERSSYRCKLTNKQVNLILTFLTTTGSG